MPDGRHARDLLLELYRLATLLTCIPASAGPEADAMVQELEVALHSLQRAVRLAERRRSEQARPTGHVLTDRERAIALCLARGQSYKDVATRFGLTVASAQSRVRAIYLKLGIHSKNELERLFDGERPPRA